MTSAPKISASGRPGCVVLRAALSGCAVGPDFETAEPPDVDALRRKGPLRPETASASRRAPTSGALVERLWIEAA